VGAAKNKLTLRVRNECSDYFLVAHEVSMFLTVGSYYFGKYRGNFLVAPEFTIGIPGILLCDKVLMDSLFCFGVSLMLNPITILVN
jgi:hypothetical protein